MCSVDVLVVLSLLLVSWLALVWCVHSGEGVVLYLCGVCVLVGVSVMWVCWWECVV